eukprot:4400591-Prymnesium_polylepis.1
MRRVRRLVLVHVEEDRGGRADDGRFQQQTGEQTEGGEAALLHVGWPGLVACQRGECPVERDKVLRPHGVRIAYLWQNIPRCVPLPTVWHRERDDNAPKGAGDDVEDPQENDHQLDHGDDRWLEERPFGQRVSASQKAQHLVEAHELEAMECERELVRCAARCDRPRHERVWDSAHRVACECRAQVAMCDSARMRDNPSVRLVARAEVHHNVEGAHEISGDLKAQCQSARRVGEAEDDRDKNRRPHHGEAHNTVPARTRCREGVEHQRL